MTSHARCRNAKKREAFFDSNQQRHQPAQIESNEAVRRRILWFAHEHKLPPTEIEKALTGRVDHIGAFIKRHGISYDWMLFGDLKGLPRMPMKRSPAIFTPMDVVRLYAELTMEDRRDISLMIAALLNKGKRKLRRIRARGFGPAFAASARVKQTPPARCRSQPLRASLHNRARSPPAYPKTG
jgi:hypothetical protein